MDIVGLDWVAQNRKIRIVLCFLIMVIPVICGGCNWFAAPERNDLTTMETARITIKGQQVEAWLAVTNEQRTSGLMQVTEEELTPIPDDAGQAAPGILRGMLFVFPVEQPLGFWMRNTIIPLDIAYIRRDGVIVNIYTMAPLEIRIYPSVEPAIFALEVRAGTFAQLGIQPGDHVEIPESVLKATR